jgi:hypothetical protein
MTSRPWMSGIALTALLTGPSPACTYDTTAPGSDAETPPSVSQPVAAAASALTAQSNAEQFQWTNPEWDVTLRSVDSHICFLTGVGGEFDSYANVVVHRSSVDQNEAATIRALTMTSGGTAWNEVGPDWKLSGYRTSSDGTTGDATCVPRSDFIVDPGGELQVSTAGLAKYETTPLDCDANVHADLWDANAVSYLSSVQGEMEGFGELAEIIRPTGSRPAQVHAASERCDELGEAGGRSLAVGVRDDGIAPYQFPGGVAELVLGGRGEQHMMLGPTAAGVCFLTKVSGAFHGRGERVRILPSVDESGLEVWMLSIESGGGEVTARASCVYYDQRYMPEVIPF